MPSGKPSSLGWLGIGRELIAGVPVPPSATVPVSLDAWEPEDTPHFLADEGIRAVLSSPSGMTTGTQQATFSYGGPFYLDSGGFWLDSILGDVSSLALGISGGQQLFAAATLAGAASFTLAGSAGSVTTGSVVQVSDGAASEVVIASADSTGLTVNCASTPLRFPHAVTAKAALLATGAGFTHRFASLAGGTGQPPTHSLTDVTGLTAGTGARSYPMAALSSLTLSGDPGSYITARYAGSSWISQPAAATPVAGTQFAAALPGWAVTISIGGVQYGAIGPWTVTFTRPLAAYWGAQGLLVPVVFARGDLRVTGTMGFTGPAGEDAVTNMTTAGMQPVVITASNGLSGTSALSLTITASQAQFTKAKPVRTKLATGFGTAWSANNNSTDTGGYGGQGPVSVVLGNNTAVF